VPVRLSEGTEQPAAAAGATVAPAEPLPAAAVAQVIVRLPAMPAATGEAVEFAMRPSSQPAPRPGQTIQEPFPPPAPAVSPVGAPESGPLEILRYQPEGDVPLAPYLSVTFNQPMVALTSLQDLAKEAVPVKLSPLPAGKWRWVGTKTLMFEPTVRFPMATRYTAEIPAGTKSATGGTLAKAVTWTFTTPPPTVQASYPTTGPVRRDVLMFVAFDQKIDPAAVLATIKVGTSGRLAAVRLATADEVKADKAVSRMAQAAQDGRWLAFKTTEPLPYDADVTVTVGPGTPSSEGPLKTDKAQSFNFRTYGPLRVMESRCGYDKECRPLQPWSITFSNPLDTAAFDPSLVKIQPEVPGVKIQAIGNTIQITGRTAGRTNYKVTLSKEIRDEFEQNMAQDATVAFNVGTAQPSLAAPGGSLIVLDPSGKPTYSVYTINYDRLKVQANVVTPEDWRAWQTYQREYYRQEKPPALPGRQVMNTTIAVKSKPDELIETAIDLTPALQSGLGQLIVVVEPDISGLTSLLQRGQRLPVARAWIQATRIGLDAFADGESMVAWANDLSSGSPLNGVRLSLQPSGGEVTSDDAGAATLPLPSGSGANLLVARKGSDLAILPQNASFYSDAGWQKRPAQDSLRWYVFDDRKMYRPGEEVNVKGWLRRIGGGKTGDVGLPGGVVKQVSYRLRDARGNEILKGTAPVGALGGFSLAFKLPDTINLGNTTLELTSDGPSDIAQRSYGHSLQVQEFRRPEFEVKATAPEGPFFVNDDATVSVAASYYAGGGLPNADVTWRVSWRQGEYSPPGWDDFTFGIWTPWWRMPTPMLSTVAFAPGRPGIVPGLGGGEKSETYTGKTDATGVHRLKLDFGPVDPPLPTVYSTEASVMDVNRQAWNSSTNLLVHPASLYVGLRSDRMFVQREQPLKIEAIVTELDGKPAIGKEIKMRAVRLDWQYKDGKWQEVETAPQPCTVTSAKEPVRCTFETPEGGTYKITAQVVDDKGRTNRSEFTRWVAGGQRPPARQVEQEEVTLIPDRKEYQPGDTAEILVQSPFFPAEGIVTLRRSGIVESQRFAMSGPTYTLKVPIKEAYIPNLHVQIDLVGAAPRTDDQGNPKPSLPKRPAYAKGELDLSIPPLARTLKLDVAPRDAKLEPGGKTTVDVVVRDAKGQPVSGAELAIAVVDEAVLALTSYQMADPISVFYSQRAGGASDHHTRANIVLVNPEELNQLAEQAQPAAAMMDGAPMPAPAATGARALAAAPKAMAGAAEQAAPQAPIAVRTDFNPLALFAPAVATNAEGKAQVEVKVPDNLTRYRVMVVAVADGKQFGKGESAITARLPLMVRPSPPRFLNFGDRFELPVVLQNQTDAPMAVDVIVRGTNIGLGQTFEVSQTSKVSAIGKRVTVPANDRVEVRFPATTVSAGTARFQVGAASGKWADAAQFELPVWTPATTEAFAVYGVVDQGAIAQPVIAPSNVYTQFGGLEITLSSTAMQALTDAFLYLQAYPFECSEQVASRVLSVAALRDVLTAFRAEGLPPPNEIEAAMARDIERLKGMQNSDGGWPIWRKGEESWPYYSIHAAHSLARAKQKSYVVPADTMQKAQGYLREIERYIPSYYGQDARRALIAYALYVRKLTGDADPARARSLIKEAGGVDKLSFEALGWIMPTLSDDQNSTIEMEAIRRHLNNRVTETAGTAHFVTSYGDSNYLLLHSDRHADGILLDALIGDQPQSDLIPKIVKGLMAHRTAGRWANTQENAFILLALDRYFNTYEAQTPDFVARVWLGDGYAGDATFRGRTTEYRQIDIPMSYLSAKVTGTSNVPVTSTLVLSKEGAGRLYYRLGLRYAPTDLRLPPYEAGFTVERVYEAVDNPDDVKRDSQGVWHIKSGARVRVRLTMVAPTRRYHVALVDPLPAGFEALNPTLAVTGSIPQDPQRQTGSNRYWWWWRTWYEHQNMRDERIEAFASLLWDGVHTYTYVARATTPGTFIAPPTKAEEMYAPETFGRGAVDIVVVE